MGVEKWRLKLISAKVKVEAELGNYFSYKLPLICSVSHLKLLPMPQIPLTSMPPREEAAMLTQCLVFVMLFAVYWLANNLLSVNKAIIQVHTVTQLCS